MKNIINKIKIFSIIILITALTFSIYSEVLAGAFNIQSRTCRITPIYNSYAKIKIFDKQNGNQLGVMQQNDHGCGYSTAEVNYIINGVTLAHAKASSPPNFKEYWSKVYWLTAGDGYKAPLTPPSDSIGITKGSMTEDIEYDTISHLIQLNNFNGALSASLNTDYGSTLLYVVWVRDNPEDTTILSNKVLWKGSASIEGGQFLTDGFFNPADFLVSNSIDSATGIPVKKVVPVNNLQKNLPVDLLIDLDDVAVSSYTEGGYGSFNEAEIIIPNAILNIKLTVEGHQSSCNINTSRSNIKDRPKITLCSSVNPNVEIDTCTVEIDSISHSGTCIFNKELSGSYYIKVNDRNTIETWSRIPVFISSGTISLYDFTTSSSQAYGNNLRSMCDLYSIYSGDINQDGLIDIADIVECFNASTAFLTGYVSTDVNGDGLVDIGDVVTIFNNANNFIQVIRP